MALPPPRASRSAAEVNAMRTDVVVLLSFGFTLNPPSTADWAASTQPNGTAILPDNTSVTAAVLSADAEQLKLPSQFQDN